ncbi:MAG: hypothetical protein PVF43_11990 [Candidatus Eiseniibacteriota bacterium]
MTAALLVTGLIRAWQLRWVCDDAFISFRYAEHLATGHGLVWNPGERVEGFSNLLWTLGLSIAAALGLDLVGVAEVAGWVSLAIVVAVAWRLGTVWSRPRIALPLTACLLPVVHDVLVWSTGGLETMTVTALIGVMVLLLFENARPSPRRELAAGITGALVALTRVDGVLVAATLAAGHLLVRRPNRHRVTGAAARALGPIVLAVAGQIAFRLVYYGDWLPNTYDAKSAGTAWWDQGLVYVGLLLIRDHVLLWIALAGLIVALLQAWRALRRARCPVPEGRGVDRRAGGGVGAVLVVSGLVFTLYVARSGGDFMFARRLVPVLPLFMLALERALIRSCSVRWRVAVGLFLLVSAALPYPLYERHGEGGRIAKITDERAVYPSENLARRRAQGEALGAAFRDLDASFLIEGGLCMLAYYSRLPDILEINGLTDRTIARQPIGARGIPGHEKGPPGWLLDERRVHFVVLQRPPARWRDVDLVSVGDGLLTLKILYWDPALMAALRHRPGVRFLPIADQLASVHSRLDRADCETARRLFAMIDRYYLRWHAVETGQRAALEALVERRCR